MMIFSRGAQHVIPTGQYRAILPARVANHSVGFDSFCPDTFLCKFFTFLNASISVKTSPINTKLGDFVNLGVLFLTM